MGINYRRINNTVSDLNDYSKRLSTVTKKINNINANINSNWKADEVKYLNQSLEKIKSEIDSTREMITSLGKKISNTASEIKTKEDSLKNDKK